MWENLRFKSQHAGLVAACFVLSVGFGGFLVAALLVFPNSPQMPWSIAAVVLVLALLVVFALWDRPRTSLRQSFAWVLGRRRRDVRAAFELQPIKGGPVVYGTHRPPTPEELRELKDGSTSTWVPSGACSGRRSVRDL